MADTIVLAGGPEVSATASASIIEHEANSKDAHAAHIPLRRKTAMENLRAVADPSDCESALLVYGDDVYANDARLPVTVTQRPVSMISMFTTALFTGFKALVTNTFEYYTKASTVIAARRIALHSNTMLPLIEYNYKNDTQISDIYDIYASLPTPELSTLGTGHNMYEIVGYAAAEDLVSECERPGQLELLAARSRHRLPKAVHGDHPPRPASACF